MQKFIRILAIAAAVLVALSFLLLLFTIPFQRMIADGIFGFSGDTVGALPIFPVPQFVNCFLLLGCTALLIVCAGSKRGGIWLELLLLGMMALILPPLSTALANVQNVVVAQVRGDAYVAANSIVSRIASFCMWPGNLGRSLALVVCGMSMAFKHMNKKLERIAAE